MEPTITLTILTQTFDEFVRQAKIASTFLPYIQIDVMDGKFVPTLSFPERDEINDLDVNLKYELHLMVADPVAEMRTWQGVESVFRVLFHFESTTDPLRPISFARKEGWEVGMVINPDTPLSVVEPFLDQIDVLQFMTVYPGAQGAPFEPKVLDKVREFIQWRKISLTPPPTLPLKGEGDDSSPPFKEGTGGVVLYTGKPLCAVDGAVNPETIVQLRDAGVEIFNVGSYFTKAEDMRQACEELRQMMNEE